MARFRNSSPVSDAIAAPETNYDVLSLRRLRDFPTVRPLVERREGLLRQAEALTQQRATLAAAMRDIEHAEALRMAELGDAWDAAAPSPWRQAKADLEEFEGQERLIQVACQALDDQIEEALSSAREAVAEELNRRRRPHVEAITALMRALVAHNGSLHAVERQSQRLLGFGSWHLVDGGLGQRLYLAERTLRVLERAASADPDAAATRQE
jgi:hypothetical protein